MLLNPLLQVQQLILLVSLADDKPIAYISDYSICLFFSRTNRGLLRNETFICCSERRSVGKLASLESVYSRKFRLNGDAFDRVKAEMGIRAIC